MNKENIGFHFSVEYSSLSKSSSSLETELELTIFRWMLDNEVINIEFSLVPCDIPQNGVN